MSPLPVLVVIVPFVVPCPIVLSKSCIAVRATRRVQSRGRPCHEVALTVEYLDSNHDPPYNTHLSLSYVLIYTTASLSYVPWVLNTICSEN
jgi:hypothetical protein